VSAEPIGEMPFPGVACHRDANLAPTGAAGKTSAKAGPEPCSERPSGVSERYIWRFETEVPAKVEIGDFVVYFRTLAIV
jgi:hypothetical protein